MSYLLSCICDLFEIIVEKNLSDFMRKKKTLRKNYEFKNVLTKGKMYAGEQILIYISPNKLNENFIGIAISSKLCNAVKRNAIKRKIKENYRFFENKIKKGNNIVFLWNKRIDVSKLDFNTIKKDMENIFDKAGLL